MHLVNIISVETVLTVEEAVENLGFGLFQLLLSLFCGLIFVSCIS